MDTVQRHDLVEVTDVDELHALLGRPNDRARTKERTRLTPVDRRWLAASPFCLVGTSDAAGHCDVSPKGDPAGFTVVLDDTTIALPERPGNKRADGFHNLLSNPHIGLLYLIPGRGDTLRINGRARILSDAPFFDDMIVKGHRPRFAVLVDIDTVFYHCAKSFLRSALWDPATWDPTVLPRVAEIIAAVQPDIDESIADLDRHYEPQNYLGKLYGDGNR